MKKTQKKLDVVIIEDDPTIRLLIKSLLHKNFNVKEFDSAQTAFDEFTSKSTPINVLILDKYMQGMNGIEFLAKFKLDSRYKNVPVIMLTGASSPEEIGEISRMGVFYYIQKPVKKDLFMSVIDAAIENIINDKDELF